MQKVECRKVFWNVAGAALPAAIFAALLTSAHAQQLPQSATSGYKAPSVIATSNTPVSELPDSPGAVATARQQTTQQDGVLASAQQQSSPSTTTQPDEQSQSQSVQSQKPVGTAAAEAPTTTGVAASQPAGVAIAPAKQRRVRTIVLKVGAIVGAGVAIGTVVALTAATPSKPPGAH
jgi:hypothetical protein